MSELIITQAPPTKRNWSGQRARGLRWRLHALGISDAEMRYRPGVRHILGAWTGEEQTLLDLVKRRWKVLATRYHEANGGDPEKWKQVNTLYSAALKRIVKPFPRAKPHKTLMRECLICHEIFEFSSAGGGHRRKTCSNECKRLYRVANVQRRRKTVRTAVADYRHCDWCERPFSSSDRRKRFCRTQCRRYAKYHRLSSNPQWMEKQRQFRREFYYRQKSAKSQLIPASV